MLTIWAAPQNALQRRQQRRLDSPMRPLRARRDRVEGKLRPQLLAIRCQRGRCIPTDEGEGVRGVSGACQDLGYICARRACWHEGQDGSRLYLVAQEEEGLDVIIELVLVKNGAFDLLVHGRSASATVFFFFLVMLYWRERALHRGVRKPLGTFIDFGWLQCRRACMAYSFILSVVIICTGYLEIIEVMPALGRRGSRQANPSQQDARYILFQTFPPAPRSDLSSLAHAAPYVGCVLSSGLPIAKRVS